MMNTPSVAILLCTYNGAQYLQKQLDSLLTQTHQNISVYISDDGSTDASLSIIENFKTAHPQMRIHWRQGLRQGSTKNFLSLVCANDIQADYYAFCDQDDLWMPQKISAAIEKIQASQPLTPSQNTLPMLYCGRTELIDAQGRSIGHSPAMNRYPPSFGNALIQNIGGGNTQVFNHSLRVLIQSAGFHVDIELHDWWLYLICMAYGGVVFYDMDSHTLYRQHAGNLVGQKRIGALVRSRVLRILQLYPLMHVQTNLKALRSVVEQQRIALDPSKLKLLEGFFSNSLIDRAHAIAAMNCKMQNTRHQFLIQFLLQLQMAVAHFLGRID